MKVKVLRNYKDKYTGKRHKKAEVLEISEERYKEINSSPFGVFVAEVEAETQDLENMTKKELIQLGKTRGVEFSDRTTKAEMLKELT